ncbi:MAG: CoA pyrophosphatase [Bacteroidetes bacterium]|nr:CoA pyrophosphatase [Bacteroidota bacterium]
MDVNFKYKISNDAFSKFAEVLNNFKLPGIDSQLKMAPEKRKNEIRMPAINIDTKKNAVLFLLYPKKENIFTVLIQRKQYDGVHGGQISFPGGRIEENETLEQTAKRETFEEIGLDVEKIEIIGQLTNLYIPPSNNLVYPFVGYVNETPRFVADGLEVSEILEIDLNFFFNEKNIESKWIDFKNQPSMKVPCFVYDDKIIWGATAMIIMEFVDLISKHNLAKDF